MDFIGVRGRAAEGLILIHRVDGKQQCNTKRKTSGGEYNDCFGKQKATPLNFVFSV